VTASTSPSARRCGVCGSDRRATDFRIVDGEPICLRCLFGDVAPIMVWPIGVVRSAVARAGAGAGVPIGRTANAEIHLAPGMRRFLAGLEEERALTVVWYAHAVTELETVFARGLDGKMVGAFASRTPARPNPIAITEVTLVAVRDLVLVVHGLDAIDGTPVLDLKLGRASIPH
jgi:tRNA (Thr-GGU) A37 N-methylase